MVGVVELGGGLILATIAAVAVGIFLALFFLGVSVVLAGAIALAVVVGIAAYKLA